MATEYGRKSGSYSTAVIGRWELVRQDISGNYSVIRSHLYFYYGGSTSVGSSSSSFGTMGVTLYSGSYRFYPGETDLGYTDFTVYHNADGTFPATNIGFWAESYHISSGEVWGTIYGYNKDNHPEGIPIIPRQPSYTSKNATNITEHSARLTGSADTKGLGITGGGWDISTNGGSSWTYYDGGPTDKTITGLKAGTQYWYRGYVTTAGGSANSEWGSFTTKDCVVRNKINGTWKTCVPFLNINGTWKKVIPYIKVNGTWKEGIN